MKNFIPLLTLIFFSIGTLKSQCVDPSLLSAINVTANFADITWQENGTATDWDIEFGPAGFVLGTGVVSSVTMSPYSLTGLIPTTSYCFYVRSNCGPANLSAWVGPYCFTTTCNTNPSYTYVDNGNGNYSFTNTSSGGPFQSHWAFGDGNTSTTFSPSHTFSANGIYLVVLTTNDTASSGSCSDYYTDTINVTGVSNPTTCNAGYAVFPDTNGIAIYNSSTGNSLSYLWDFGDGNTSTLQNPTHTYTTAGPFYLCLTVDDGAGCIDQFCDSIGQNGVVFNKAGFTISVSSPIITGVEKDVDLASTINIYPNPASNELNIINQNMTIKEINIADVTGKVWKTTTYNSSKIDVSDLPAGIYFVKVINTEKTIIKKVVIQ